MDVIRPKYSMSAVLPVSVVALCTNTMDRLEDPPDKIDAKISPAGVDGAEESGVFFSPR